MKKNSNPKLASYFIEEGSPSFCSQRFQDVHDPIAALQRYYRDNKPYCRDLHDHYYPLLDVKVIKTTAADQKWAKYNYYLIELHSKTGIIVRFFISLYKE